MEGNLPLSYRIDAMQPADWGQVCAIYAAGLVTGVAAFLSDPPDWKVWDATHLPLGRLVARQDGVLHGWAALSPVADT